MNNQEIFKNHGFCIVRNAISDELRDFVTQYALFDEMQDYTPEGDVGYVSVPNAHSKYVDPAMETMLLHLQSTIEEHTGLSVFPTYSYYRVYRKGDDLKKHKDRPSCEISATMCFNYSYDDSKYQWPIYMDGNAVALYPGDLVIYRGCDLEHWRESFNIEDENDWHVQGFFHFVDANGPYTDYKFDQRTSIGALKNEEQQDESTSKVSDNTPSYITYV